MRWSRRVTFSWFSSILCAWEPSGGGGTRGDGERGDDPRDVRVNATLEKRKPQSNAHHAVHEHVGDALLARNRHDTHDGGGGAEVHGNDTLGEAHRDDGDGAEVINGGEGEEEGGHRGGMRFLKKLYTPIANAMSVAMGMAQPAGTPPGAMFARR